LGTLLNGLNGPIRGKVGKVIGSSRNGVPYVKGPYKKRTKSVSGKELLNRKKFAEAQAWLSPLLNFLQVGFKGYSQRAQGFIAAKSWLLKNAVVSNGNDFHIDPSLVKVSSGDLPNPPNIAVTQTETGDLVFTWDTSSDTLALGDESDQIMMLAYDVTSDVGLYKTTGQFRSTGTDTLQLRPAFGNTFQVYAAFNAADRSRQSDSVYLGEWKI
jgi:hypothetical protein